MIGQPPTELVELQNYPDYGCTPDGQVWSRKSGNWRALALTGNGEGYLKVKVIDIDGKVWTKKAHVLIAEAFLGDRPESFDINHKNGIKTDNRVPNIEYLTRAENVRHAIYVLGRGPVPDPMTPERQKKRIRAMRMRGLSARLWLRDGRISFSRPAQQQLKLTAEQVTEIRKLSASKAESRRGMARRFGISKNTVDRIISREKWAHLP
jgi:hypothetical protein